MRDEFFPHHFICTNSQQRLKLLTMACLSLPLNETLWIMDLMGNKRESVVNTHTQTYTRAQTKKPSIITTQSTLILGFWIHKNSKYNFWWSINHTKNSHFEPNSVMAMTLKIELRQQWLRSREKQKLPHSTKHSQCQWKKVCGGKICVHTQQRAYGKKATGISSLYEWCKYCEIHPTFGYWVIAAIQTASKPVYSFV